MSAPAVDVDVARADALRRSLRAAGEIGDSGDVIRTSQMSGGWSRSSFAATVVPEHGAPREYVVRAKPQGGLLDTDLESEYHVYAALAGVDVPVPAVYALEMDSESPFGGPFFVMERLRGSAPNVFRARERRTLEDDWRTSRRIATDAVDYLARIHAVAPLTLGESVPRLSYLDAVSHWQDEYERVRVVRDPVLEEAFAWLRDRVPSDEHPGLVHADYRPGNMLVDSGRVTAVLDWELAYYGDVRFDLGYLSLRRVAGQHVAPVGALFGALADEQWFLDEYAARVGRQIDRETVRTFAVLASMMLAVIMLTGVRAYTEGRTSDVRMAWNQYSLAGLRQEAAELMRW